MAKSNEFQSEISSFLNERFNISYRIDDTRKNRFGNYQVSKKPFDFFGSTRTGILWGAEIKRVRSQRFYLANLKSHQCVNLNLLQENKCLPFIFINWRFPKNTAGKAIWLLYEDFVEIVQDKKSTKPEDFDSKFFLERVTGGWKVTEEHYLYLLR